MATSKLISAHIRRRTLLSLSRPFSLLTPTSPTPPSPHPLPSFYHSTPSATSFRFFSSNSFSTHSCNSLTELELQSLGLIDGSDIAAVSGAGVLEDSILPVRAVVSLLDGFHQLTGLPWWIVIVSSTVALRVTLLPWVILQIHKLKQIAEALPKLPPPLPPPLSGKSFVDQLLHFERERRAHKCPSLLWFLSAFSVQVPCFILWVYCIRKMSLNDYPGFDTGGVLWFQDLTEAPSGGLCFIFPLLISGLHFYNVQYAFRASSIGTRTGLLALLADWYRKYLKLLTIPIMFTGFVIPQGSLVYWTTNSSLSLIQQICLQNPVIRQKLGLPDKGALPDAVSEQDANVMLDAPSKRGVSAFDLSPLELVHLSVSYLSSGKAEKAANLLRLAVEKDPDCFRAWTILGQIMMQTGLFHEAAEYSECAIEKISLLGEPSDAETIDFLIQASVSAGAAYYRQGKLAEARVYFERVRDMKEPESAEAKARYYEGLVVFASVLANEGQKDEAIEYLRRAIAHDPQYTVFLTNLESNKDDIVSDLASSRRADY